MPDVDEEPKATIFGVSLLQAVRQMRKRMPESDDILQRIARR